MPFKPFPSLPTNKDGVIIIPKGYVKLPEPMVSDYIIPNSVVASSELYREAGDPTVSVVGDALSYSIDSVNKRVGIEYIANKTVNNSDYVTLTFTMDFTNLEPDDMFSISILDKYLVSYSKILVTNSNGDTLLSVSDPDLPDDTIKTFNIPLGNMAGSVTDIIVKVWLYYTSSYVQSSGFVAAYIYYPFITTPASAAIDGDTTSRWYPGTTNPGEWLQIDAGSNSIIGGARIYWGSNVPNAYRIQASVDGSTWVDVYTATSPPTPNSWTEYSWPAVYARYLRLYLDDQGLNPVEVAEFQYYSRITDRVAAEHGHGSGPEPWKKGAFFSSFMRAMSKGGGTAPRIAAMRGFHRKKRLNQKINDKKKKSRLTKQDILELIEELREYIDFKVPD